MESENLEFELFWLKLREVFGNQFIEYCNEEGISKFEKMLNILFHFPYMVFFLSRSSQL